MAEPKDRFGLDIPAPKPPGSKPAKGDSKVKLKVPKGYRATQRTGLYKKIKGLRRKKRKKLFAKAEPPSLYAKIYEAHKQKMLGIVTNFFTQEIGVMVEWLKDMTNVRRKVRKTLNYHAILTAGVVLLLIGIATYLECICPQMFCGLGFAIVGLAAIIVALVYRKHS